MDFWEVMALGDPFSREAALGILIASGVEAGFVSRRTRLYWNSTNTSPILRKELELYN